MRWIAILLCLLVPTALWATDYYATNNGTVDPGSGSCTASCSGTGCCKPSLVWDNLGADDTLYYKDGTYTGTDYMIRPPSGTSGTSDSHRVTIAALNDGEVLLDPDYNTTPIYIYGSYVTVTGFNARNCGASGSQYCVRTGSSANYDEFKRLVVWDGLDDNTILVDIRGTGHLVEDVAAFGVARKLFGCSQAGTGISNTFRRIWGRWEGSCESGPKMDLTLFYNNDGMIVENAILTWDKGSQPATWCTHYPNGLDCGLTGSCTSYCLTDHDLDINGRAPGMLSNDGGGSLAVNGAVYGSIVYVPPSVTDYDPNQVMYMNRGVSGSDITLENVVTYVNPAISSRRGFQLNSGGSNLVATDLTSVASSSDSINGDWAQTDVEHSSSVAGLGDSIYVGNGAHVCYQYVDEVETATALFPWPMDDRIAAATTLANDSGHTHEMYICSGAGCTLTTINDPHAIEASVTDSVEAIFGSIPAACGGGATQTCGNQQIEGTEVCDGTNLNGEGCGDQAGYDCGTLACESDCTAFDVTNCVATPACGNNVQDTVGDCDEVCDGTDLAGQSCQSQVKATGCGTLACAGTCDAFDTSGCIDPGGCLESIVGSVTLDGVTVD